MLQGCARACGLRLGDADSVAASAHSALSCSKGTPQKGACCSGGVRAYGLRPGGAGGLAAAHGGQRAPRGVLQQRAHMPAWHTMAWAAAWRSVLLLASAAACREILSKWDQYTKNVSPHAAPQQMRKLRTSAVWQGLCACFCEAPWMPWTSCVDIKGRVQDNKRNNPVHTHGARQLLPASTDLQWPAELGKSEEVLNAPVVIYQYPLRQCAFSQSRPFDLSKAHT